MLSIFSGVALHMIIRLFKKSAQVLCEENDKFINCIRGISANMPDIKTQNGKKTSMRIHQASIGK